MLKNMLGDWLVIIFLGWEQTFEDMNSIPYLTRLPKGWSHYPCSEICVAPSIEPASSIEPAPSGSHCSFLNKWFLFLEGWFLPLFYFGLEINTLSSLTLHVKCHLLCEGFPDSLFQRPYSLISTLLCTEHQGTDCFALLNCLLADSLSLGWEPFEGRAVFLLCILSIQPNVTWQVVSDFLWNE